MSSATHAPDSEATHEFWQRLGMQLRLGLYPDDPRLVARYLFCGDALMSRHGYSPWWVHDRMLSLMLATAYDPLLPMVRRLTCLDACSRPMSTLGALVCDDTSAARLRALAHRLASFSYNSADPECTP